ncbi:TetR/AcrR family transcriptional regulator [Actinomycetospora sp. CA-101289]|uniref:TetR/AcrR family transcriptional regulator n=1 Tax=Actinomycetospora sp. CA-101289 TaxID=3239893 RepID=UPI003D96519F
MAVKQGITGGPRRLTARGAATRARIVTAAADLMYLRGVGATSMDDVIEASGTGKSQLYHYFADKDALVLAVVSTQIDRVLGFQEPLLRGLDSLRGLQRWRDAVVSGNDVHGGGHGCPLGSLAAELADHSEPVRAALVHGFDAWEALIADGLSRMRATGELTADADPDGLAAGVMAALQGGLLLAQTRRDPRRLAIAIDMALDHVRAAARP